MRIYEKGVWGEVTCLCMDDTVLCTVTDDNLQIIVNRFNKRRKKKVKGRCREE